MRVTDTHVYFWNGIFSNWHRVKFIMNGLEFTNTEQAFMYLKAKFFDDVETSQKILVTFDPQQVKRLGREIKNFKKELWDEACVEAMVYANNCKFQQNAICELALRETDSRILVEASPYDKIWGVGLAEEDDRILNEKNWLGKNLLGKSLMQVRNSLPKI